MLRLLTTRLALAVVTLFAVSVLIFAATEILPGEVASAVP
jgi:peptide/nickel transport system permease protein